MCHETCPAPVSGGAGMEESWIETPGAGRPIPGFFVRPEAEVKGAVVIAHDIHGANPFYQDLARRLAGAGYAALLPDLFVRQGPAPDTSRETSRARGGKLVQSEAMADLAGAFGWLRELPGLGTGVGLIGFCMGGTLAMLAATEESGPDAAVAFYGFPGNEPTELRPRVPLAEASSVRVPLLGLWGDQDAGVGMDKVEAYRAALAEADRQFEFVIYPGPGHAFLTFDPDAAWYAEAQDAWARTLAFFEAELGG
jgi:carboxymethylenebutenolidase